MGVLFVNLSKLRFNRFTDIYENDLHKYPKLIEEISAIFQIC